MKKTANWIHLCIPRYVSVAYFPDVKYAVNFFFLCRPSLTTLEFADYRLRRVGFQLKKSNHFSQNVKIV